MTPGGETISVNGTLEKVVAALDAKNPKWKAEFDIDNVAARSEVEKRAVFSHSICRNFPTGKTTDIPEQIRYLRGLQGRPSLSPHSCGQVSCTWDTSVW